MHWYGKYGERSFNINPNVLAYWKQRPSKAFDRATGMSSDKFADTYLGLEANALIDCSLLDSCRIYGVGSVFIPGGFYTDVKGTPLTKEELRIIDTPDATGITNDRSPLLGNDIAFTLNFGIECRF